MGTRISLCLYAIIGMCGFAHAEPIRANAVLCNSAWEMTKFITMWDGKNGAEVGESINKMVGKAVCGPGTWLMEDIEPLHEITAPMGVFVLHKITLVGLVQDGLIFYGPRLTQYMVKKAEKAEPSSMPPKGREGMRSYIVLDKPPWSWTQLFSF